MIFFGRGFDSRRLHHSYRSKFVRTDSGTSNWILRYVHVVHVHGWRRSSRRFGWKKAWTSVHASDASLRSEGRPSGFITVSGVKLVLFFALLGILRSQPILLVQPDGASTISFRHHASPTAHKYLIETMGGGVGLLDYDGDGFLDIFFTNGATIVDPGKPTVNFEPRTVGTRNALFRNLADGRFVDVTNDAALAESGGVQYGMGAAVGDVDNDGDPDLFLTRFDQTMLHRNNGDGTFSNVTDHANAAVSGWSASAGFFDYDSDGDLDLFVTRYLDWDLSRSKECGTETRIYCSPRDHEPVANVLLENNGRGEFKDISFKSGVSLVLGKALGVAFEDADDDGDIDVFVANDSEPQQLLVNLGDGRFRDDALLNGLALNEEGGRYAGMGVDFADYDNDGQPDVIVTNLAKELYAIYRNEGDGFFNYVTRQTQLAKITARMSGWGVRFADFDLDGWKDLFVAQSHVLDNVGEMDGSLEYLQPPLLARNVSGRFVDVSATSGPVFQESMAGRGGEKTATRRGG